MAFLFIFFLAQVEKNQNCCINMYANIFFHLSLWKKKKKKEKRTCCENAQPGRFTADCRFIIDMSKWKKTEVLTINMENLDQPLKWSKEL